MGCTFVGIGFGAIQSGLFLYEAHRSGHFDRYVVAEVIPEVVAAVRKHGGYAVNVATRNGIDPHTIEGVEILNPAVADEAPRLIAAIAEASEIGVALPSVAFYDRGDPSPAALVAAGLKASAIPSVVYAGENHNHAAEILAERVRAELGDSADDVLGRHRFLNTVIGKMSGVVTDAGQIAEQDLLPVAPGIERAFLVEAFNRILISQVDLAGFTRGIEVFVEKPDLLPFEEAKLYGHNATHALVGYLAHEQGYDTMAEALRDEGLRDLAREAFLHESGDPLIARYGGLDPLFTPEGYAVYVDDLLARMGNPYLSDAVERIIRDPRRKLGWDDRLVGTIRLALAGGVEPVRFARGTAAALSFAQPGIRPDDAGGMLRDIWGETPEAETASVIACIAGEL